MKPRAICTFSSIAAVILCMFFATAVADCLISTQSGTVAELLALKASQRVGYVSIHLNAEVSRYRACVTSRTKSVYSASFFRFFWGSCNSLQPRPLNRF